MSSNDVKIDQQESEVNARKPGTPSFLKKCQRQIARLSQKVDLAWNRFTYQGFFAFECYGFSLEWLVQKVCGMSKHEYRCSRTFIGKDGRVRIPSIEWHLARGCNLKCDGCNYVSPIRAGLVSKEALADSFKKWSCKIAPERIVLLGGEPLLNPDIAEIVTDVRHYWPQSRCCVITNGLLLPKISEDVLRAFRKCNFFISISDHVDTQECRDTLQQALVRLKQCHVRYDVTDYVHSWLSYRDVDGNGVPVPFHSNAEAAYRCCVGKMCTMVEGDYLHRCGFLANMMLALREGAIGSQWNPVLTHKPVSFENSPAEIRDYLCGGPMPECSVCPEKIEKIEARQLSMEDIQRIKQHIQT